MENETDFLELSVVNEIIQKIEQINAKCEGQVGIEVVEERVKEVAYAKILCNVYDKDNSYLIKAYTNLGIAYLDINYCQQSREHLTNALKLNDVKSEISSDDNSLKESQIKILINLSKGYLEPDKSLATSKKSKEQLEAEKRENVHKALEIAGKCLKMNQKLFGVDHISNADIYYIMAKSNERLERYEDAIKNLKCMYNIYENEYGEKSDKIAKLYMEMGQVYDYDGTLNDAITSYKNAYCIYEEIIDDNDYEELFHLAVIISDLYSKIPDDEQSLENAYLILAETEDKYSSCFEREEKNKLNYQQKRVNACSKLKDKEKLLEEYLKLEEILVESGINPKARADTCISLAYIYLNSGDKDKYYEYMAKAREIHERRGDKKLIAEIDKNIEDVEEQEKMSEQLDKEMNN